MCHMYSIPGKNILENIQKFTVVRVLKFKLTRGNQKKNKRSSNTRLELSNSIRRGSRGAGAQEPTSDNWTRTLPVVNHKWCFLRLGRFNENPCISGLHFVPTPSNRGRHYWRNRIQFSLFTKNYLFVPVRFRVDRAWLDLYEITEKWSTICGLRRLKLD